MKKEATQHFDAIKKAAALESTSSLRIGYHALRLKDKNLWGILGFADETEARLAAGVKDSTWYSVIRLAEDFRELPEAQFVGMKLSNAKALSDLPESKRLDKQWISYATDEPIRDFAKRVDEEMNGKARPSDTKERSVKMSIDMPASRKAVIEEKVKEFAEAHGIESGDVGKVIEVSLVENTERVTLVGAIANAGQHIKRALEVVHSGLSADEALEKVTAILGEMALEFEAALDQATNGAEEAA
jgi:hypothetical protein